MQTAPQALDSLRGRRPALGLSQQRLAQLARCSISGLRLYERGFRPTCSPTLDRIERVLAELEAEDRAA
jgi:transcriptional regulator with XRE-family HTH domain